MVVRETAGKDYDILDCKNCIKETRAEIDKFFKFCDCENDLFITSE